MPLYPRPEPDSTPICRCRVLYLGSAVPHVTKDGLQGIQEPLRELYPEQGALGARGIDSWLSVWSNGLLLENVDENHKKVTRFFPIDSLHYCAAVRYVLVPEKSSVSNQTQPRFLPLDSPFARSPNPTHPPLFAAILRRTTGIKVLECHAFICKREMAANALVRCCFHAYADSSYAKQIIEVNGNGSIYGTLCNGKQQSSSTIDKVEDWRLSSSQQLLNGAAGSSLTLNSAMHSPQENGLTSNLELSNSADDLSIYNGDENHKVWAGSTRDSSLERDAIYGEYNGATTMKSTRSSRPRQSMNVPPPPPPPPPKEEKPKKSSKERSKKKKISEGSRGDEMYYMLNGNSQMGPTNGYGNSQMGPTNGYVNGGSTFKSSNSVSGGTIMRGYPPGPPMAYQSSNYVYSNGTMLRPASSPIMNGFHPIGPQPHPPMLMVPTTLPHPPRRFSAGSYPHKPKSGGLLVPIPRSAAHHMIPPHNFIPIPPQPIYIHTGRKNSKQQPIPMQVAMEEPIYMPSDRPMSPIASYQPGHFPHEAYLMQQYAASPATTADVKSKKKNKNKSKKESIANSQGSRGNEEDADLEEGDSIYNTGIYRRKGHLNERAFSYSIRQEHRSRSYGSLANLKFTSPPVVPNGNVVPLNHQGGPVNKEDIKKEREIMQMMHDLELSGDELERSEVPQNVYQNNRTRAAKMRR